MRDDEAGRRKIVLRNGIRRYLAGNAPELSKRYKTAMRYKAITSRASLRRDAISPINGRQRI